MVARLHLRIMSLISSGTCESEGNLGLRQVIESHSRLNASMDVARVRSASSAAVAPCAAAVRLTCPLASGAVVAVHVAHNSGEFVVSCPCRGPLATTWVVVGRVPREQGAPKVGFPVRPQG